MRPINQTFLNCIINSIRTIFLVFVICIGASLSFAQQSAEPRNLYAEALSSCINKEDKQLSKIDSKEDYKNRVVAYDEALAKDLPAQFGDIKIAYLSSSDLAERYKKNGKELLILSVKPMRSNGITLEVNISRYLFSYKKRLYNYALEGGCYTEFGYDTERKQFTLNKTELWGV